MNRIVLEPFKENIYNFYNEMKEPSEISSRKRNLTLDFQMFNKKTKLDVAPVLSSPDLKKLKLKTPEVENMILLNGLNGATPTPTASQLIFPKTVTDAQEDFARGFDNALKELHYSDSSQGPTMGLDVSSNNSNSSVTYTDLQVTMSPSPLVIKEEQIVPNGNEMGDSPRLSPINMESQEIIKLERKRMRNRVAASKCRRRKLERIAGLEDKVKRLKSENQDLSLFIGKLKEQVCSLKGEVLEHAHSGCAIKSCW